MRPQIRLTRIAAHPDHGTFGSWVLNGQPMAVTLEPYWRENATGISSIPTGVYTIVRHNSPTYGECFKVTETEGRTHVLIHPGNWDRNTRGCILLGEKFEEDQKGDWMVQESGSAVKEFMKAMKGYDSATLTIIDAF